MRLAAITHQQATERELAPEADLSVDGETSNYFVLRLLGATASMVICVRQRAD